MKRRLFPLAACASLLAAPAAAQAVSAPAPATPALPPGFALHREAESCWIGTAPGNETGVAVGAGRSVDGARWVRFSGRDWAFAADRVYRIRMRGVPPPAPAPAAGPAEGEVTGEGIRDAAGWPGFVVRGVASSPSYTSPAVALYLDDAEAPFATLDNPNTAAWVMLNDCWTELVRNDRGSGEPADTQAAPLRPFATYITSDDYPARALRAEEQGRSTVRLTVSAHGILSDCAVVESSGSAVLDTTTCRLLQRRVRFTPARDAQGRLTQGTIVTAFAWRIPASEPPRRRQR
jgi:TonB family protein